MNSPLRSRIVMSCGIHICPRKCHNPRDHKNLACAVRVQVELPCGHNVSRRCQQSEASDLCFRCEVAKKKAELDKASEENETETSARPSTPISHRLPTPPTSPMSPWRGPYAATTTNNKTWRPSQSTDRLSNVFSMDRGPRQSTDADENGFFGKQKPQPGSSYSPRDGLGGGSWRK